MRGVAKEGRVVVAKTETIQCAPRWRDHGDRPHTGNASGGPAVHHIHQNNDLDTRLDQTAGLGGATARPLQADIARATSQSLPGEVSRDVECFHDHFLQTTTGPVRR